MLKKLLGVGAGAKSPENATNTGTGAGNAATTTTSPTAPTPSPTATGAGAAATASNNQQQQQQQQANQDRRNGRAGAGATLSPVTAAAAAASSSSPPLTIVLSPSAAQGGSISDSSSTSTATAHARTPSASPTAPASSSNTRLQVSTPAPAASPSSSSSAAASPSSATGPAASPDSSPSIQPTVDWGIYVSTLAGCTHSSTLASNYDAASSSAAAAAAASSAGVGDTSEAAAAAAAVAAAEEEAAAHREQQSVPVSLDSARFLYPRSVCTSREERHLLLSDSGAIRHVNTTRKMVGVLSSAVEGAGGMFRDHNGCIWIADTMRHAIKKITPKGELVHVAGSQKGTAGYVNGSALAARFREPMSVCSNGADASASTDGSGSGKQEPLLIFIADAGNCCIRVMTDKGVVSTLAGAGPQLSLSSSAAASAHSRAGLSSHAAAAASSASSSSSSSSSFGDASVVVDGPVSVSTFVRPVCVAFDHADSSLVISDAGAHSLRRITAGGLVWTMAGRSGHAGFVDGPAYRARFREPWGLAIDSLGRTFVSERGNHSVRVLTPSGLVHTICGDGNPGMRNGAGTASRLYGPTGLALDPHGSLLLADTNNHLLRRVQFVILPLRQREVGNTSQLLLREWSEFKERAEVRRKQEALHAVKLERQLLELKKELAESKKEAASEFAKVRAEMMQVMQQLISSMQAITSDKRV